jgi:ATP-dependent Lhr-like helicase
MPLPFHPFINTWFAETYGKPTPVQEEAWPLICKGGHVLALAPTGSGKTLTGFLAAISRFAEGTYPADRLSVLYISPLKALNEDIRRNLTEPLAGIGAVFERNGEPFPAVRVETRSGDTPQSERRRFLSRPPSILALTPESLGILLLNPRGRQALSWVRYVIIDEIHTSIGTKRGVYLSCQIDRLAMTAGEFQRIGLSATVKPPEAAADFAGGLVQKGNGAYEKRKVHIVAPPAEKKIQFSVEFPEETGTEAGGGAERYGKRYAALIAFITGRIRVNGGNGTVLVFTDSRRRAERISYLLNRENPGGAPLAYTHHGSLSKDVRRAVEQGLVEGRVPCVVATGSLELGIDIGGVGEVILAGSPDSAAVCFQRVGRSGHGVGMTSRGTLIPFHSLDLLQAAAVSGAVRDRELEETRAIENPLDILAQVILALCVEQERNEDELYELLRGFYAYRGLSRSSYDGVVRMLAGAYEGARIRELKRRVFRDDATGTLTAAPGALGLLYSSGGVIASRGYYSLRIAAGAGEGGTKIGELDEEFVWERRLGDTFDFGNRSWQIVSIGSEAVEVSPLQHGADYTPFWKGDAAYRSSVLARRILELLDRRNGGPLENLPGFSREAAEALEEFLAAQKSFQGKVPLPGPRFIPIEIIDDISGRGDSYSVVFHTFRGGAVNYPLGMALARDIEAEYSMRVEAVPDDNAVLLRLPRSISGDPALIARESLRRIAEAGTGEKRFRERLESSGVFGAAFREAAERSLLLPRSPFGRRTPLWVLRQRSKQLFDATAPYRDFPAAAEAWRVCLNEQFDIRGFNALLEDLGSGAVATGCFRTKQPSPFSRELAWVEVNTLMYVYDERPDLSGSGGAPAGPSLSDQVIAEALGSAAALPPLKAELVKDFSGRVRRELPLWAPEDALGLSEWVKERVAIPADEWELLLKAIPEELSGQVGSDPALGGKLLFVTREGAALPSVVHREWAKRWKELKPLELAEQCLGQWLRCEGPLPLSRIGEVFGLAGAQTREAAAALEERGELTVGVEVSGSPVPPLLYTGKNLVCDSENLELLLRLSRKKQRPQVQERPAPVLVPYLAIRQGLLAPSGESNPWEKLAGFTAQAKLWETELFPARCPGYSGEMLDREIRDGRLLWYGAGKEKAGFCEPRDLDLVFPASPPPDFSPAAAVPPGFFDSPRNFWEIKDALYPQGAGFRDAGSAACAEALWREAWKGSLSADSWEPVRRALETGFVPEKAAESGASPNVFAGTRRIPRALRDRWRSGPPVRGGWFSLADQMEDGHNSGGGESGLYLLEEEELNKDRVRLLLARWGVLCRPLLEREAPVFSWSRLLPAMRRMELAGEIVTGRFFAGVNSLQFASPAIAGELEEAENEKRVYWMNAADPASPAGLEAAGLFGGSGSGDIKSPGSKLPSRIPSSRLVYRGAELIAVSKRNGKAADIFIPPDDPDTGELIGCLKIPRTRAVQPEKNILIETINGKQAASGEYAGAFKERGFVADRGRLVLW